jgi:hypothetical protein
MSLLTTRKCNLLRYVDFAFRCKDTFGKMLRGCITDNLPMKWYATLKQASDVS